LLPRVLLGVLITLMVLLAVVEMVSFVAGGWREFKEPPPPWTTGAPTYIESTLAHASELRAPLVEWAVRGRGGTRVELACEHVGYWPQRLPN
jgi:hypothetical protein